MVNCRAFIPLWTLAVVATCAAFLLHLALRSRVISLGYELGRARTEQQQLREAKRVLQLEAASYKSPERVERVARSLLGMDAPSPEQITVISPRTHIGPLASSAESPPP